MLKHSTCNKIETSETRRAISKNKASLSKVYKYSVVHSNLTDLTIDLLCWNEW